VGSEIIFPIAAVLDVIFFVWLLVRSVMKRSRPFALPTFFASLAFAFLFTRDDQYHHYWDWFVLHYCGGVILFGLQAHAIQWLVARRDQRSAS
jgi:hypothetical protein